jgi:hypothetical protein
MRESENAQQVHAAIAPAKARSPLSKVKRDRTALRTSLELSARKRTLLLAKCHRNEEKIAHLKRLNNQLMVDLLQEKRASNKIINDAMIEVRPLSAEALDMMTTAHKIHKATWKYLSISGSPLSYWGCPEEVKEGLRGLEATNHRSKSALGGTTHQLQKYGHIGITNAAAVSDAKTNGYFSRFSTSGNTMKGMFHQFEQRMRECLLTVGIEMRV